MSITEAENNIIRNYQYYPNVNFDSKNEILDTKGNPEFCKKLCDMTANCVGFIMNNDNSHCWLKKGNNIPITNPNYSYYQVSSITTPTYLTGSSTQNSSLPQSIQNSQTPSLPQSIQNSQTPSTSQNPTAPIIINSSAQGNGSTNSNTNGNLNLQLHSHSNIQNPPTPAPAPVIINSSTSTPLVTQTPITSTPVIINTSTPPPTQLPYKLYPNIDYPDQGDIGQMTSDIETCQNMCNNTENCVGFVFDNSTNECSFKSNAIKNPVSDPNYSFYVKNISSTQAFTSLATNSEIIIDNKKYLILYFLIIIVILFLIYILKKSKSK